MNSRTIKSIMNKLRKGKITHLCISRDIDLLGDCSYEEHLIYNAHLDTFVHQQIDWNVFTSYGFRRGVAFKEIDEEEARELIVLSLEFEKEIDDK